MKKLTYEQANAVIVLAAERMGLSPSNLENAKAVCEGRPIHMIFAARLEAEACRVHNMIRADVDRVCEGNRLAAEIAAEYGLSSAPAEACP